MERVNQGNERVHVVTSAKKDNSVLYNTLQAILQLATRCLRRAALLLQQ